MISEDIEKGILVHYGWELEIDITIVDSTMEIPQNLELELTPDPATTFGIYLGIYLKKKEKAKSKR